MGTHRVGPSRLAHAAGGSDLQRTPLTRALSQVRRAGKCWVDTSRPFVIPCSSLGYTGPVREPVVNKTTIDQHAKCRDESVEVVDRLFSGDNNSKKNVDSMRIYCSDCPVMNNCRDYAIVHEEYCNYGGTTARERKAIRNSGQYLEVLYRAAQEGWLLSGLALGAPEDIQDALWAAQTPSTPKPAPKSLQFAEIQFDLQPFEILLDQPRMNEQTVLV